MHSTRLLLTLVLMHALLLPTSLTKTTTTPPNSDYHDEEYTYDDENSEDTDTDSTDSSDAEITRINCPIMCHCEYNSTALERINHQSNSDYYDYDADSSHSSTSDEASLSLNLTVNCANASLTSLTGLFDDQFPVEHIVRLNLASNRLASLKSTEFEYMTSLELLDVSANPTLSTLPLNQLKTLISLKELVINDLELLCDCGLKSLIGHLNKNEVTLRVNEASRCLVETGEGSPRSINAHMTSYPNCEAGERVSVRIEPRYDQLVFEGDSVKLRCRVTLPKRAFADSRLELQWSVNGRVLKRMDVAVAKGQRHHQLDVAVSRLTRAQHSGLWVCALVDKQRLSSGSINESHVSVNVIAPRQPVADEVAKKCGVYELKNTMKGDYVVPESPPGHVVTVPCRVNGAQEARFRCSNSSGAWAEVDLDACEYEAATTRLLSHIARSRETVGERLSRLEGVAVAEMSAFDLSVFVDVLERLMGDDASLRLDRYLRRFFQVDERLVEQSQDNFNTLNKLHLVVQRFYFQLKSDGTPRSVDSHFISTRIDPYVKSVSIYSNDTELFEGVKKAPRNASHLEVSAKFYGALAPIKANEAALIYWNDVSLIPTGAHELHSGLLTLNTSVLRAFECLELMLRYDEEPHSPSALSQLFELDWLSPARLSLAYSLNNLSRRSFIYSFTPIAPVSLIDGLAVANICNNTHLSHQESTTISFALIRNETQPKPDSSIIGTIKTIASILTKKYKSFASYSIYFGAVATQMLLLTLSFVYIAKSNCILMSNNVYHCLVNSWIVFAFLNLNELIGIKQTSLPLMCLSSALLSHFFTLSCAIWFVLFYYNFYKKLCSCHENNERLRREHAARRLKKEQAPVKKINLTSLSKRDPSLFDNDDDMDALSEQEEGDGYEAKPHAHLYMMAYGVPVLLCSIGLACAKLDYFMPFGGSVFEHCYVNQHDVFVMTLAVPLVFLWLMKVIFGLLAFVKIQCILSGLRQAMETEAVAEGDESDDEDADAASHCTSVMDSQFRPQYQLGVSMLLFYIFAAKSLLVYFMVDKIIEEYRACFLHAMLSIAFSITCFSFYCLARDDLQFNGFYHVADMLVGLWKGRRGSGDANFDGYNEADCDYEKPPLEFVQDGVEDKQEANEVKSGDDKASNHSSLSTSSLSVLMKNLKEIKEAFEGVNGSPAKIYSDTNKESREEVVADAKEPINEYQLLNEKTTSLISFIDQHGTATISSKEENSEETVSVSAKKAPGTNRRYQHQRNPSTLSGCLNDAEQQLINSIIQESQSVQRSGHVGANETMRSDTSSLYYQSVSNRANRTSRRPLYVYVDHSCTEKSEENVKGKASGTKKDSTEPSTATVSSHSIDYSDNCSTVNNNNSNNQRRQSVDDGLKAWTRRISDASQFKHETSV